MRIVILIVILAAVLATTGTIVRADSGDPADNQAKATAEVAEASVTESAKKDALLFDSLSDDNLVTDVLIEIETKGYYICRVRYSEYEVREEKWCRRCPSGTEFVSYNPGGNPEGCLDGRRSGKSAPNLAYSKGCDGLYDMKKLGWRGGNKTKWCAAKGYDGHHSRDGSSYNTGNYCWNGSDVSACKHDVENPKPK